MKRHSTKLGQGLLLCLQLRDRSEFSFYASTCTYASTRLYKYTNVTTNTHFSPVSFSCLYKPTSFLLTVI